jgi:CMP/dCMP kinase
MLNMDKVVAIDGPSGSGKSSIAKAIAKELGFLYVDTGAMYRSLGYYFHEQKIPLSPCKELFSALKNIDFSYGESETTLVKINGRDLTLEIRAHAVSEMASLVSQIKEVRDFLTRIQRELVLRKICVMEGRDIGTVVFPNAFCKIFLTADTQVRAKRRYNQLKQMNKLTESFEKILEDIELRDMRDIKRVQAPLVQANDAVLLDTSNLNFTEVIAAVKKIILAQAGQNDITL